MYKMEVTKRNGTKEQVQFDKISNRLRILCNLFGFKTIDSILIAQKTIENLYNGITTQELDELSARVCATLSSTNPKYSDFGGVICVSNLQKMTPDTFYESMKLLVENKDIHGNPCKLLDDVVFKIIEDNKQEIEEKIDHKRDYNYDFFGFKTLEKAYLMKSNGVIVERPQYMLMRVAIGIHQDDLKSAFKTYDLMSSKLFTHASPTLFNAGTKFPQLSSCFLTGTKDNIEGIYKTITDCALISKRSGGIGIHVSNIRAAGSLIRTTNGKSDGIIPMLQVYNYTARYINQGGRRPGSFAVYLEPWHADVFGFLDLRKNTGSETDRARDLFLALWIPDKFMEAVVSDSDWYLMCPDECPGLQDVWGDDFNSLYEKYISEGKYRSSIKARKLWRKIIESQIETGNPYMLFKDHINKKSNQSNIGTIKSSNLCAEIVEYSDNKETAVCNLASIALNMFVEKVTINSSIKIYSKSDCKYCKLSKMLLKNNDIEFDEILLDDDNERKEFFNKLNQPICDGDKCTLPEETIKTVPQIYFNNKRIGGYNELLAYMQPKYNFEGLKNISSTICKNLNKVIDINMYPTHECYVSNMRHRPIGIGVQGLADTYFKMRFAFDSKEAHQLNKEIFEAIYYGALEASIELSREREIEMEKLKKNITDINNVPEYYDSEYNELNLESYHKLKPTREELNRETHLGSYSTFIGSPFSEGKLQFDLWNASDQTSDRWDWAKIKSDIVRYGSRNSLLTALMPTASTSQILGNNECFEPITSNIYKRRTQAGEFKLINQYLINDLINYGIWDENLKDKIIFHNGSILDIDEIPDEIKNLYKIVWEIPQKHIVHQSAERGIYIDQTQSMNIFMEADYQRITSSHFASWKLGLKTGMYYFRTKPGANAKKISINMSEPCESCSA